MDQTASEQTPDYTYGIGSLAMALAIRDSQVPVPIATEIAAQHFDPSAPPIGDAGLFGKILAGVCIALVVVFLIVVVRGL
jgi:hypothetical protein